MVKVEKELEVVKIQNNVVLTKEDLLSSQKYLIERHQGLITSKILVEKI